MNYFIVQILGSVLLVMLVVFRVFSVSFPRLLVVILILKIGVAPTHQWVLKVVVLISLKSSRVLLSLQKINPLLVISYFFNKSFVYLLFFYRIINIIVGGFSGMNQLNLVRVLVFSSLIHIRWIFIGIRISDIYWVVYLLCYIYMFLGVLIFFRVFQRF